MQKKLFVVAISLLLVISGILIVVAEEDLDEYTLTLKEPAGEGTLLVDGQEVTEWPYVEV